MWPPCTWFLAPLLMFLFSFVSPDVELCFFTSLFFISQSLIPLIRSFLSLIPYCLSSSVPSVHSLFLLLTLKRSMWHSLLHFANVSLFQTSYLSLLSFPLDLQQFYYLIKLFFLFFFPSFFGFHFWHQSVLWIFLAPWFDFCSSSFSSGFSWRSKNPWTGPSSLFCCLLWGQWFFFLILDSCRDFLWALLVLNVLPSCDVCSVALTFTV